MDLQCGHFVESSPIVSRSMDLEFTFHSSVYGGSGMTANCRFDAVMRKRVVVASGGRTARLPCRPDLFRRSEIRLREPDPLFCASDLAIVALLYSLVHPAPRLISFDNSADHGFGSEHETCDRSGILQSRARHLGGIDHAGLH